MEKSSLRSRSVDGEEKNELSYELKGGWNVACEIGGLRLKSDAKS